MEKRKFYPNQYEFLGHKIYVAQNHPAASDDNPGTPEKPFKTISAATASLKMADHVYIDSGVYREEIPLPVSGHMYVPNSQIHFHAVGGAEVYIKGSEVFCGKWKHFDNGVWQAELPEYLFADGVYNPYKMALTKDAERTVRPCDEIGELPKTKGQIYVDDKPYQQVCNLDAVKKTKDTFIISGDGRSIIANFGTANPSQCFIELTIRRRCIVPQFSGTVFIQTHGICVEHAAEPGPFCKDRPESLRENPQTSGIAVTKTFCLPGVAGAGCSLMPGQICYVSTETNKMICSVMDDTAPVLMFIQPCLDASSIDAGKTWTLDEGTRIPSCHHDIRSYFLDECKNVLMRHWIDNVNGKDPHGAFGVIPHNTMFQFSCDAGETWSMPRCIDNKKIYCLSIVRLNDGGYIWPYYTQDDKYPECGTHHTKVGVLLGCWNEDESDIIWRHGGFISVSPQESNCGLSESSIVQCSDGRLISFLRAGAMPASQEHAGVPSVKLVSVSNNGGQSWAHPVPLCYEDGKYIYSPRAYQMAFKSIKNNKIYVLLNISNEPTIGCDPRTHLYMAEVDQQTLRVPRKDLTLIEAIHPEHHNLTRFSNFQMIQDRVSKNPIIFMKLDMSEFCPIWQGYDRNMYRYEIFLSK